MLKGIKVYSLVLVLSICNVVLGGVISSSELTVVLDESFPRIVEYLHIDGGTIGGELSAVDTMRINGQDYRPRVVFSSLSDKASYILTVDELDVIVNVDISVDGEVVTFAVSQVQELGDVKVKTVEFAGQGFISVSSAQPGAGVAVNSIVRPDVFEKIEQIDAGWKYDASYAIVYNDKLAATIWNNTLDEWQRHPVRGREIEGVKYCVAGNNLWIYHEIDTEVTELPVVKIIITGDRNGNGGIDWQDGGIAYRDIMEKRFGSDVLRQSFSHIAIDFASVAQWPFLRILDNIKKLSLYTDGFGQMLLIKGYQSEGHDSAHPDYGGNFNSRAGGVEDFNFLCEKAKQWNTHIGVHINHTEAYPEAKYYTDELVNEQKGWRWLDQSWKIDRKSDITAGNLYKRLAEMKAEAPYLSFVYVDVYDGKNWVEWKLGEKLNEFGWAVWTEFHPHFDAYYIWTHQPAGTSKIGRFIMNAEKDTFAQDKLLKGYYHRGFMGWDDGGYEKDIHRVVDEFMTKNLPTKYMQNFELLEWTDEFAKFSGGLEVRDEDGVVKMVKEGRVIALGRDVFIPWDPAGEEKIYHWNDTGGKSSWQLPTSWSGLDSVVLYELTDLGRKSQGKLSVVDGKVTIDAKAKVPYVVYKKAVPDREVVWGEGALLGDVGFDSHGFGCWGASDTGKVVIKNDSKGQTVLAFKEGTSEVSQLSRELKPDTTYSASVWVQTDRQCGIRVEGQGIERIESTIDKTDVNCYFPNSDKNGSRYQRVRVLFDTPGKAVKAKVVLFAAGAGGEEVLMDDVRLVEAVRGAESAEHYYYEDFENVDEGWGPFYYAFNGPCQTHLSELHEGYTDDTVAGRYSFKSSEDNHVGMVVRTVPSVLRLEGDTEYTLSFDYITDQADQYQVIVDRPFVDDKVFKKVYKPNPAAFENFKGKSTLESKGGKLAVKSSGDSYSFDADCPAVADGEMSFVVDSSTVGRLSLIFRYTSQEEFGMIGYDTGGKWVWGNAAGSYGTLASGGPKVDDGGRHTVVVRFVGSFIKLTVDGEEVFAGAVDALPLGAGKVGFRNWYNSSADYSDMKLMHAETGGVASGTTLFESNLDAGKGNFSRSFRTGGGQGWYIGLKKLIKGQGKLVIDNITVDSSQ